MAIDAVDESERHPQRVTTRNHLRWAGALGVGAVAVLGVLQSAIGAFNPRPIVSVLIGATVFFAGLWAQRIASRRATRATAAARDIQLREILGVWPPEVLPEVDALRLGVYPIRRDADPVAPYIEREVDGPLRAALHDGCVALVHGPARSGKSRTALEAICQARPGARILAPRGRHALAELLALEPPVDLGEVDTVVWLDGIERYAGTMDALSLDGLVELTRGSTVVMTVRDSDWTRLLAASGDRGETARAVAARAQAYELRTALTADEKTKAQGLYPGIDFAGGVGAALAARGTETAPPPERDLAAQEQTDPVPAGRRDPELVLPLAGIAGALAAVALIWIFLGFSTPVPPTLGQQIAKIRHEGSAGGLKAQDYNINLRGPDADSSHYFLFKATADARHPRSDEVEIYDIRSGRLKRTFDFYPKGPRAVFRTRITRDVDGDGNRDLIAGLAYACGPRSRRCPGGNSLLPVAISWDDEDQAYELVSLNPGPPVTKRPIAASDEAEYSAPVTFTDRAKPRETVTGYRVQNFDVTKGTQPRMIAGYLTTPPTGPRIELHGWSFDASHAQPHVSPCESTPVVPSMTADLPTYKAAGRMLATWKMELHDAC